MQCTGPQHKTSCVEKISASERQFMMPRIVIFDEQWKELEKDVLRMVKREETRTGFAPNFRDLCDLSPDKYTKPLLQIILQNLTQIGKLFNTPDDEHYMSMEIKEKIYILVS